VPLRRTVIRGADLDAHLATLRSQLDLPGDFAPEVMAEADAAAKADVRGGHVDATDLNLVTLDPPGSKDLDQAFAIERRSGGYTFWYAIADVAAFVAPGGAVDAEAHRRGETLYLPGTRIPLHPLALSEGATSLLPGQDRPAVLWRFTVDDRGEPIEIDVRRAMVRSRAQLDYPAFVQADPEHAALMKELGELRQAAEVARGGVSLPVPEQEVSRVGDAWQLDYRAPLPDEGWNAQLSLLTGMGAAKLMLDAGVGMLRTMPPPPQFVVDNLRRSAKALGLDWPHGATYADVIRKLDATVPAQAALLRLASVLFRGASYVAFDGTPPTQPLQSAVAAPYAHATAPLRRLGDRYVSECCLAACAGAEVPEWVRAALPALPAEMAKADQRAHAVDRAVVDLAEALLLQDRVGEVFCGVVVEVNEKGGGEVQLGDPAVRARLDGGELPLGEEADVRLSAVDVANRKVVFVPV
jgi:exoribonuclease R